MDANLISLLALVVTVLMSAFTVYSWKTSATHDEVGELRQRVERLEEELQIKEQELRTRDRTIFNLMTEIHNLKHSTTL